MGTYSLILGLSWETKRSLSPANSKEMMACIALVAWMHLVISLRVSRRVASTLLPLLVSFLGTGSIVLVSLASFAAFLHVICILDDADRSTTAGLIRTLFLSDGIGIEAILRLGLGTESRDTASESGLEVVLFNQLLLLVISFTFCVCVLNLFIAVHSKAYHDAIRDWPTLYEKERAHMCELAVLLPYWKGRPMPRTVCIPVGLSFTILCLGCLLIDSEVTQWMAGLLSTVGQGLISCILMQRPWNLENPQFDPSEGYLWLCYHWGKDSGEPDMEEKQTSINEKTMGQDKVCSTPAVKSLEERIDRMQAMMC